jgi:hypothetical protein
MVGPEVGTQELLMQVDAVIQPQADPPRLDADAGRHGRRAPRHRRAQPRTCDYMIPGNTYEQVSEPTQRPDRLGRHAHRPAHAGPITTPRSAAPRGNTSRNTTASGATSATCSSVYKQATGEPIKFEAGS